MIPRPEIFNLTPGLVMSVEPCDESIPANIFPNSEIQPGYLEIVVVSDGSNPRTIGRGKYWSIKIVQNTQKESMEGKRLNNDFFFPLSSQERIDSIVVSERRDQDDENGPLGIWLDVLIQDTENGQENTLEVSLMNYPEIITETLH